MVDQRLSMQGLRGAVAAVDVEDDKKLVIVSLHLKCCGYSGSEEDPRGWSRQSSQSRE